MLEKYNSDPERCADLVNGCAFGGEQLVDASYLKYKPRKKALIQPKISNTYEESSKLHQIKTEEKES